MKKRDHIVFRSYGLVNGDDWKEGYKDFLEMNVNACLYWASECADIEIYADQYDIRSIQYHHDGHHNILYRELKPKLTDWQKNNFLAKIFEGKVTRKDITRYTRSILPYVKEVYGW